VDADANADAEGAEAAPEAAAAPSDPVQADAGSDAGDAAVVTVETAEPVQVVSVEVASVTPAGAPSAAIREPAWLSMVRFVFDDLGTVVGVEVRPGLVLTR
jgi:hypothetical protein